MDVKQQLQPQDVDKDLDEVTTSSEEQYNHVEASPNPRRCPE